MPRDYKVYLEDILEAIGKIQRYTANLSQEAFSGDERTLDAVVRNLEIIGEASKKVPGKIRSKYPEVEWKRIAGLRDILIHEYFGIDIDIIWDIVQNKLPVLEKRKRTMRSVLHFVEA
jgi:uncharacterized protein with HEPN domain